MATRSRLVFAVHPHRIDRKQRRTGSFPTVCFRGSSRWPFHRFTCRARRARTFSNRRPISASSSPPASKPLWGGCVCEIECVWVSAALANNNNAPPFIVPRRRVDVEEEEALGAERRLRLRERRHGLPPREGPRARQRVVLQAGVDRRHRHQPLAGQRRVRAEGRRGALHLLVLGRPPALPLGGGRRGLRTAVAVGGACGGDAGGGREGVGIRVGGARPLHPVATVGGGGGWMCAGRVRFWGACVLRLFVVVLLLVVVVGYIILPSS